MRSSLLNLRTGSLLALVAVLSACVAPPPQRTVMQGPPVPPAPPQLMIYPARGQSEQQLERDRYDCHVWAVQQSGYDPSRAMAPGQRVVVQPGTAPGTGTAVGAIAGAILGAALTGPRDAGAGMLMGGITGGVLGAASDANAQAQANAEQASLDRSAAYASSQGAYNYRRAMSACLDARGYTIA